ncbi:hypothetical protein RZS08_00755, partial [Arthrospira platensis SPKY1]|nr:hypothetical protein [Arthrospira platensis SPKY1]
GGEQAVIAHPLVIERRQHQHTGKAERYCPAGETHGVRHRTAAGSGQQHAARDAALDQRFKNVQPFLHAEGVGFAGGAEDHQGIAAVVQQPAAMQPEATVVRGEIGMERGQN